MRFPGTFDIQNPTTVTPLLKHSLQIPPPILSPPEQPKPLPSRRFHPIIIPAHRAAAPPACFDSLGAPVAVDLVDLAADLKTRIAARLNPLFRIEDLVLVAVLPRTASNKLMRRELRARYPAPSD